MIKKITIAIISLLILNSLLFPNILGETLSYNTETYIYETNGEPTIDMIVICQEVFEEKAIEFVNWKNSATQLKTELITVEEINNCPDYRVNGKWGDGNPNNPYYIAQPISNYGRYDDSACHIRNCIRKLVYENKLKYVLLYGYDVPARKITKEYIDYNVIKSADTLWYGCLSGTQNSDDDQTFWGKFTNDIQGSDHNHCYLTDTTMDVIVGRIPAKNNDEFDNILTKTQIYHTASNTRTWAQTITLFDDWSWGNMSNFWDHMVNKKSILVDYDQNNLYNFVTDSTNPNRYNLFPKSWKIYLDDISNGTVDYPEGYSLYVIFDHGEGGWHSKNFVFGNSNNPFFCYSGSCEDGTWDGTSPGPYYMRHDVGGPCIMIASVYGTRVGYWIFKNFYTILMDEKITIGEAFKRHWDRLISKYRSGLFGFGILGDPSLYFQYLENPVAHDIKNTQDSDDYGVTLSARVYDFQDDTISVSLKTNISGSWQELKRWNNIESNTSIEHYTKIFGPHCSKYWWSLNCTDGKTWMNITRSSSIINIRPLLKNSIPAHSSNDVRPDIMELSVDILDVEKDPLDWSIITIPDIGSNSGSSNNNCTIKCPISILDHDKSYQWQVSVFDGYDWQNVTFSFKTKKINTSVETIRPYHIDYSPLRINANSDPYLDNVTLWYRFSQDNNSWNSKIILDQHNDYADSEYSLMRYDLAQSFTPNINGKLEYIHLSINNIGEISEDISVMITEQKPYEECVIASATIPGFTSTEYQLINVTFDNPPELICGKLYYIVLSKTPSSNYLVQMNRWTIENDYPGGSAYYKYTDSWDNFQVIDFVFKTFMNASWKKWDKPGFNPDTNESDGWSWDFDFPEGFGYYEFYSIGKKFDSPDEIKTSNADAICFYNQGNGYTIKFEYIGNGRVVKDPNLYYYSYNQTVNLTALPDSGWEFSHWNENPDDNINPLTIKMDANKTIAAHFKLKKYQVNISYIKINVQKFSIDIKNTGETTIENINWNMTLKGGILGKIDESNQGTIDLLEPDSSTTISFENIKFGLGLIKITIEIIVNKEIYTKEINGLIIGRIIITF
jgi:hypothetical protein